MIWKYHYFWVHPYTSKVVSCISSINTFFLPEEMSSDCPWHLWWCSDTDGYGGEGPSQLVLYPYHPCMVYLPTFSCCFVVNVGKYTIHVSYGVDTVIVHPWAVNGVRKKKKNLWEENLMNSFNTFLGHPCTCTSKQFSAKTIRFPNKIHLNIPSCSNHWKYWNVLQENGMCLRILTLEACGFYQNPGVHINWLAGFLPSTVWQ